MTTWADTPAGAIARLDASLARRGENVTLRRAVGAANQQVIDVRIRTLLRGYAPNELVGDIKQQDQAFILSPTQINAAQWPGGTPPPQSGPPVDQRIPQLHDRLVTTRGVLTVQAAAGIYMADVLVRIEGRARGS